MFLEILSIYIDLCRYMVMNKPYVKYAQDKITEILQDTSGTMSHEQIKKLLEVSAELYSLEQELEF